MAIAAAALILARSPVSALPVLILYGLANGSGWSTWTALFAVIVKDEKLMPRVFARSFQLLNLGLGTGAVVAGSFVRVAHPRTFDLIYLVDGLTYLVVVGTLLALPALTFRRDAPATALDGVADPTDDPTGPDTPAPERPQGGFREVLADRRFRRYLLASLLLTFCGYASIDAGLVGFATVVVHVQPYVIAWTFAVNTALIVILQPVGLRLAHRWRRSTSLSVCAIIWASSWLVLAAAGLAPHSHVGEALVVATFGFFAFGEVLLSPVGGLIVAILARPGLEGRYMATSSSIYSVTSALGPAAAGALIGSGLADVYIGLLVGCGLAASAAFQWMRSSLSPTVDNALLGPER